MINQLLQHEDLCISDIITHDCSAHILNLLEKNIDVPSLKDKIKKIIKYFKYTHFLAATYKHTDDTSLNLPMSICSNTLFKYY